MLVGYRTPLQPTPGAVGVLISIREVDDSPSAAKLLHCANRGVNVVWVHKIEKIRTFQLRNWIAQ